MAEHVGGDADLGAAVEEAVDLRPARRERHRAVENGDLPRPAAVDLAGEREHGLARERDDDAAGVEHRQRPLADELERELSLEDLHLGVRESVADERQRVERAEQQDLAVPARQQQPGPGGAALVVVRPLHLVEDEHVAGHRRHLDRAADDRRALVHALLARDQCDVLRADPLAEPSVRLLRQHPQRARVDASSPLDEQLQRLVRLPRVGRPEVRDHRLRLDEPARQLEPDLPLGARGRLPPPPFGAGRRPLVAR